MQKSRTLPPIHFLGALVLAVALHYAVPLAHVVPRPWHLVGVLLIVIGLVFIVVPARTFKARDTAIKPFDVSSVLVQDGFFSISRNPMYLGMVLVLVGVATLLRSATPFLAPALLAVLLQMRFIRHEEQALENTFGGPGFALRSSRLQAAHELHFVDAPDLLCKTQLQQRSRSLPPDSRWTTDAEFEAITAYFQPPSADEGFNVVRHERS